MQDLIDEKEFIDEKPYNPWPFFYGCYSVVVFHSFAIYIASMFQLSLPQTFLIVLVSLYLPVMILLSVVLVLGKRKISLLTNTILLRGLGGLMAISYGCTIIIELIRYFRLRSLEPDFPVLEKIYQLAMHLLLFLIMAAILLPIASRRRKRLLRKEAKRPTASGI